MSRAEKLKGIKRVVVKIGTSSITQNDKICYEKILKFAKEISAIKKHGIDVGMNLTVYDDKNNRIVNATVISVSDEDALAEIDNRMYVRPGYIVSMNNHEIFKTS